MADNKIYAVRLNIRGKEEARAALVEYINSGATIDEDEVERYIAEKLKLMGVAL